jgi:biotin synthase
MKPQLEQIIEKSKLSKKDLIFLLKTKGEDEKKLFEYSGNIKEENVGNYIYLRGLIELSNICSKDCYYCGIRKSNTNINKYSLNEKETLDTIKYAYDNKYASIVLQSGEVSSKSFIKKINNILIKAKQITNNEIGITLSCGEQTEETYYKWFQNGAHRYLLRIESFNKELYNKIHPKNKKHDYDNRINSLKILKKIGYQVGTGVMIGLPFQTYEDLANDLLSMKIMDIDMCGMGPYIEHINTPLYQYKDKLIPLKDRLNLSFKMIAILRILMKDINIVASTALQAINEDGREKAIQIGSNILMPNITPQKYRSNYILYENKPLINVDIEERINLIKHKVGYSQWGDSKHFFKRIS